MKKTKKELEVEEISKNYSTALYHRLLVGLKSGEIDLGVLHDEA
jgi:hypothetical protein